jgi:tetratricopeptide (TPR) repeat protein
VAGAAALVAAAGALFGGVFHGRDAAPPPAAAAAPLSADLPAANTASLVRRLQLELRSRRNTRGYTLLGIAYQQRARETGDPSYYRRSEGVLRRALARSPRDPFATGGLASLALSRHRFREALRLGRRAHALAPTIVQPYGIVGDALVELGRYREAFRSFDRMVALRPGLPSYSRISYARELLGDVSGALRAMDLARDAAAGQPEPTAWTEVQLGKLELGRGRVGAAAAHFRASLAAFHGYVYGLDGLAQVEAAYGRYRSAIALERRAVDRVPLPQFVAVLGDLYHVSGHARKARLQYATIGVIGRLLRANGVRTDLETALFDIDHGIRLRRTVALARRAHRQRPSIEGDDVLSWGLARFGRCSEALHYSHRALRLGTRDALKFFHRGAIERCLGREGAARTWYRRALAQNPHFSLLWAPVARKALR